MRKTLRLGGKITEKLKPQSAVPESQCRKTEQMQSRYWRLNVLEDSFCFYIGKMMEPEKEIFIEYDELSAAGIAYIDKQPLAVKDIINRLELEEIGFAGIIITPELILIRKRLLRSSGLLLRINCKDTNFLSDKTMNTINFIDFYKDILEPKMENYSEITDSSELLLRQAEYAETTVN